MARTAKQIEDRKRSVLRNTSVDGQVKEAKNVRESALSGNKKGVRNVLKGGSLLRRRMANAREDAKKANLSEKTTQLKLKRTTALHNLLERNPIGELKPKAAKPKGAKAAKPKKAPPRKAISSKAAKPKKRLSKPKAKPRAIKKRTPKKRSSY